jgi:hypothetical protein
MCGNVLYTAFLDSARESSHKRLGQGEVSCFSRTLSCEQFSKGLLWKLGGAIPFFHGSLLVVLSLSF